MSSFVFSVIIGSALLHAVWNAIIKGGGNKLFETVMKTGSGGLIVACILPFMPPPHPDSWPYLAATCTIHVFYYTSISYAYKGADLSYAYTVMRGSSPLFTALVAVFLLGDALSGRAWLGVGLLSAGILTLAADSVKRGNFSWQATLTALCTALIIMGYTVVDGSGVRLAGNTASYICWVFFLNAFPMFLFVCATRGRDYFSYVRQRWAYGLCGGACSLAAYGLSLWAMTRAPISVVAALRETSVLSGMVLGVVFLKERMTPARGAAVLLVLAGAAVSKMGG